MTLLGRALDRLADYATDGRGKDDPPPDADARARMRARALGWLRAERDAWARLLDGNPAARPAIAQMLKHWKVGTDLAGDRNPDALAGLSEAEREEWLTLWADEEALLRRSETAPPDPPA